MGVQKQVIRVTLPFFLSLSFVDRVTMPIESRLDQEYSVPSHGLDETGCAVNHCCCLRIGRTLMHKDIIPHHEPSYIPIRK